MAKEIAKSGMIGGLAALVAKQQEDAKNLPAHLAQSTGKGNEDVKQEDLQVPRLKLIQAISDELKTKDDAFIDGARAGDLLNSVTKRLTKGEEGLLVINLKYVKRWNVWRDRRFNGGGLVASCWTEAEAIEARNNMAAAESVPLEGDRINQCYEILETPENWCLAIDPDTLAFDPIIVDMAKTKQKVARAWNTLINQKGGDRFAGIWKICSKMETSKSGDDYFNYDVSFLAYVPDELYARVLEQFESVDAQFTKKTGDKVPEQTADLDDSEA